MNIKNKLKEALSAQDIHDYLKGQVKILNYNQLTKYNNINDAFFPFDNLVILYENKKNWGHWCCCIFRKNGYNKQDTIEFFDSYGLFPDTELKFSPYNFRYNNNMILPHLTSLLYLSPFQIEYNDYQFQKYKKGYNTCGKWVVARILLKKYNIDSFSTFFLNKNIEADKLLSMIF